MASQPPVNPNVNPNPQWAPPPRRRSVFAPIFLIGVGVMLLLVSSGRLSGREFFKLFADYWPVVLILWGGIKLDGLMHLKFPIFTIVLSLFAVMAAIYFVVRDLLKK